MASGQAAPLTAAEMQAIARAALGAGDGRAVLAVSGGVDSMALMNMCAASSSAQERASPLVATVDHGLRPESADEARFVAAEACRLGLEHVTLVWDGPKPAAGIQAAARDARYRLLAEFCQMRWPSEPVRIVTAHTLDDQAETVLMRLARGSGIDGLAGMQASGPCPLGSGSAAALTLVRPLLDVAKSRLTATMNQYGWVWREDPSNANVAFERVRIRRALAVLDELGVSTAAIGRSARRLNDVRATMIDATRRALGNRELVRVDPLGYVDLGIGCWRGEWVMGRATRLRVVGAVIRAVGGLERPLSLRALETLVDALDRCCQQGSKPAPFATTIGRTKIETGPRGVRVWREIGRAMPPPRPAEPGMQLVWDNRFRIEIPNQARPGLVVRPLGHDGLLALKRLGLEAGGPFAEILAALPSFWRDGDVAAVPSLTLAPAFVTRSISAADLDRLTAASEIRVTPFGLTVRLHATDVLD